MNLDIPKQFFHRTLDDIPLVCPAFSNWCNNFNDSISNLCVNLNVPLAPDCPLNEKAFTCKTSGKVLGIYFDSVKLAWKYPYEKKLKTLMRVKYAYEDNEMDLKSMQELLGSLNDVSQMCPFLRAFKFNLNKDLSYLAVNSNCKKKLSVNAKKELKIWANFLLDKCEWFPIPSRYHFPPLSRFELISDASGKVSEEKVGCGNLGFNFDGTICFAHQLFWPKNFLSSIDGMGSSFYCKTCMLEFVGIIIPFLVVPDMLAGKYVIVQVDNIGCVFGWINRQVAEDEMSSIFVRALHVISNYISCHIHIVHVPRNSTWAASVVDRLSRDSTTTRNDKRLIESFGSFVLPKKLIEWLKNPREDWGLVYNLLDHVKGIIKCD
jgi:hypothetical protein